jgi:hypothetical protein
MIKTESGFCRMNGLRLKNDDFAPLMLFFAGPSINPAPATNDD